MLSDYVINNLYKLHSKRPSSIEELNLPVLAVKLSYITPPTNSISFASINSKEITFNSITEENPFHVVPVTNICGIEYIRNIIAIITSRSIILINSNTGAFKFHIKRPNFSFVERLKLFLKIDA